MANLTPLGVGIDHCEVDRLRGAMGRTPSLEEHCFTVTERRECATRANPMASFAARWAAKESVMKCMGAGLADVSLTDIEVVSPSGPPSISLSGRAAEVASSLGIEVWLVSLTHTETLASAVVTALGRPAGPAA